MSQVSAALIDRCVGCLAVALAATAAFMVGGGYLGSVGSAQAGGEPGNNVGSPGPDGQDVTCVAYATPPNSPACVVVGGDGEDLAPAVAYR